MTRTAYRAQIAKVREKMGVQTGKETGAAAESSHRNQVAVKIHRKNKRWFTIASNSYDKFSPQWATVQKTLIHEHTGTDSGAPVPPPGV